MSSLPPGFVLDQPTTAVAGALPPGFVMDAGAQAAAAAGIPHVTVRPDAPASVAPKAEPYSSTGRGTMLGVQSVGRGIADIAGFLPDVASMAINVPLSVADYASEKLGGPKIPYRSPIISDKIADTASWLSEKAGFPTVTPESLPEKTLYNAGRYGTQAMTGAGLLASLAKNRALAVAAPDAAPKLADDFLRPYFTLPAKATAGDTTAGAIAGTTVTGTQEMLPQTWRDAGGGAGGAIADLTAMLVGGVGGATAFEVGSRAPSSALNAFISRMRSSAVPYDPETKLPFTNKQVDRASQHYQEVAIDPRTAAAKIGEEVAARAEAGTPVPTTGLISGDTGLEMIERGQRRADSTGTIVKRGTPETKAKYSFGERDTALRNQAVDDVNALRPEAGNPTDFPIAADREIAARRDIESGKVTIAQSELDAVKKDLAVPANELNSFEGQGVGASKNIHETYDTTRTVEQNASHERFNDPAILAAEVPIDTMRAAARRVLADDDLRAPLPANVKTLASRFVEPNVEGMSAEAAAAARAEAGKPMTMKNVNRLRNDIEDALTVAIKDGQGRAAAHLRDLKKATGEYQQALIDRGGAAGEAMQAARTGFIERIAPNFREGTGGEVNNQMRRGANLRPSETADTFLSRPEDAADWMRIGKLAGKGGQAAADARTFLMDELSRRGVVKDDVINADKLASWRNRNQGRIDAIPGLKEEIDSMVLAARKGGETLARKSSALTDAQRGQTETDRALRQGPLGMVAGKDAPNAVAAVFGSGNPEASMRELVRTVGANPQGKLDLQAAVAEHFAKKVSGVAPANVSEGTQNVNFAALVKEFTKHERALAAVYGPEDMNLLRRAQAQLEPLTKRAGQATVGSITAEGLGIASKLEPGIRLFHGALQGGAEVKKLKILEGLITNTLNTTQANRLVSLAMFDPAIARTLLTRDLKEMQTPLWNQKMQKWMRRVAAGNEFQREDED